MKRFFSKLDKPVSALYIFALLLVIESGISLLLINLFPDSIWRHLFFISVDPTDTFMDFFNPIYWTSSLHRVYDNILSIYPPFVTLITGLFSKLFPSHVYVEGITRGVALRDFWGARLFFAIYSLLTIGTFFYQLFTLKTGPKKDKILFCLCILFSLPFLYWAERANYILLSIISSLFFLQYYDSPKKSVRHWAVFALAVAIAIKIYPAVLGLFLLKEKRYKDIFILGGYTVLLTVIPMFWLGGVTQIPVWLHNMKEGMPSSLDMVIGGYSVKGIVDTWFVWITKHSVPLELERFIAYLPYICLAVGVVAAYMLKEKWKVLTLLCSLMILVPGISFTYTLLFLVIPLIYLVNEEDLSKRNDFYLFLFSIIFAIKIPCKFTFLKQAYFLQDILAGGVLIVLFSCLCMEGLSRLLIHRKNN